MFRENMCIYCENQFNGKSCSFISVFSRSISFSRAALVIDNDNHIAARFIPYSGGNVLEASDPSHMDAERIRLAIRGAVR